MFCKKKKNIVSFWFKSPQQSLQTKCIKKDRNRGFSKV